MAKHNKIYGKRGSAAPITSFNFEKLMAESSKRPSASKSAGVIGKWGTTSFTSLRSSQVNGDKTGKCGISPVKCLQPEPPASAGPRSNDPFGFEGTFDGEPVKSGVSAPTQPKPRKFFKSRAAEGAGVAGAIGVSAGGVTEVPQPPLSVQYAGTTSLDYNMPTHSYSTQGRAGTKRGRGRPRGSRNASPRGALSAGRAPLTPRGGGRGRGRRGRGAGRARGSAAGRGKRKRPEWEESESEDQAVTSDEDDDEFAASAVAHQPPPFWDAPTGVEEEEQEEEEEEEEDEEEAEANGVEEEEVKPPIKLRIIRRNDTNAFVSKVDQLPDVPSVEPAMALSSNNVPEASKAPPPQDAMEASPSASEDLDVPDEASDDADDTAKTEATQPAPLPMPVEVPAAIPAPAPVEEAEPSTPALAPAPVDTVSVEESDVHRPQVVQYQKKSSIFKSRSSAAAQPAAGNGSGDAGHAADGTSHGGVSAAASSAAKGKKGLALYRHKWHQDDAGGEEGGAVAGHGGTSAAAMTSVGASVAGAGHAEAGQQAFSWDELGEDDHGQLDAHPASKIARLGASSKSSHHSGDGGDEEGGEGGAGSGLRCPRRAKDFYTVVRNVKKAHQIQESGEFQEFNDDVDYILDALQSQNPTATRCLSAMSLASKCMEPAFRMHLRAHSTVAKFFQALKDAPTKASVALCTSCIMFVLTQDRLNMDLDRDSLELMLNLLETEAGQIDAVEGKELEKNRLKVRELCEEMVRKGHAPHLQLDSITSAQLAMETLLSLTSKKAGEWFKEELRVLGGLDHIIQTVTQCTDQLSGDASTGLEVLGQWSWDKHRVDALKKVDRCLRVLENVTFQNEENQCYLLEYSNGRLVDASLRLLQLLSREVAFYASYVGKDSLGFILSESLSNLMKVVMNLTHDNDDDCLGSRVYGERLLTWKTTFVCLLDTPNSLPEEKRFDVMTLALGILINLVERCAANRDRLLRAPVPPQPDDLLGASGSALSALIHLFISKEESARLEEARTDEILDGKAHSGEAAAGAAGAAALHPSAGAGTGDASGSTAAGKEDAMEETVKKLLHKAGRHMEDSMVAAYVGLLLGYIVMNNKGYEHQVKELLPDKKFTLMVVVLKKFYEFLKLTANAVTSTRGLKNTQLVIKFMEKSDASDSDSYLK